MNTGVTMRYKGRLVEVLALDGEFARVLWLEGPSHDLEANVPIAHLTPVSSPSGETPS